MPGFLLVERPVMRQRCSIVLMLVLLTGGCPTTEDDGSIADDPWSTTDNAPTTHEGGVDAIVAGATTESETDIDALDSSEGELGDPTPALRAEVLSLVNEERGTRGLAPLRANAALDAAAQGHATDMFENDFFAHTGSNGTSVANRAANAGYVWSYVGENIAYGPSFAADVMSMWMNSPGHRANILNEQFEELGVGVDLRGSPLWVQVFGRPR
jgi:uncharacterized protein YkwD